jgi:hypothetical protein
MKQTKPTLFLLIMLSCFLQLHGQEKSFPVKGKIIDSANGEDLSLVKIETWENSTKYVAGTSGYDGSFTLMLPSGTQKIEFSHIGYFPKQVNIDLKPHKNKSLSIELDPQTFLLGEVVVEGEQILRADEIIKKVQQNLSKTLQVGPFQCDGHITSTRMKDGKYVFFGEAFFDHHNSGYAPVGHAFPISRATDYRISDQDYSYSACWNTFFPPPVRYPLYCYDHYLLPVLLNEYFNFQCTDTLFQGTHRQLVINYKLNKEKYKPRKIASTKYSVFIEQLQYGEIIVNSEDFSIEKISNKGGSGDLDGAEIKEYISTASFTKINQTHFMSDISINGVYLEPGIEDGKKHQLITETKVSYTNFNTDSLSDKGLADRYHCEIEIDNRFNTNSRWFYYQTDTKDKVSIYNPDFWKKKPKPKFWHQMKSDIETMAERSLEEQFSSNSFFLIPEKKFKSIMKKSDREKRKELSDIYKDLRKTNAFK